MLYLGVVIAVVTLLVIAFTGFGTVLAIGGIGASATSLATGAGFFFARNHPKGLAKAMSELDANMHEDAEPQPSGPSRRD